jgi:hypothetical protein
MCRRRIAKKLRHINVARLLRRAEALRIRDELAVTKRTPGASALFAGRAVEASSPAPAGRRVLDKGDARSPASAEGRRTPPASPRIRPRLPRRPLFPIAISG